MTELSQNVSFEENLNSSQRPFSPSILLSLASLAATEQYLFQDYSESEDEDGKNFTMPNEKKIYVYNSVLGENAFVCL